MSQTNELGVQSRITIIDQNSDFNLEEALKKLPENATMRDIFDFCTKHNLHNLAQGKIIFCGVHFQGMIELPPPLKLRQIAADICLNDANIHQYRNRSSCFSHLYAS